MLVAGAGGPVGLALPVSCTQQTMLRLRLHPTNVPQGHGCRRAVHSSRLCATAAPNGDLAFSRLMEAASPTNTRLALGTGECGRGLFLTSALPRDVAGGERKAPLLS